MLQASTKAAAHWRKTLIIRAATAKFMYYGPLVATASRGKVHQWL
jgi:hypothetical protein